MWMFFVVLWAQEKVNMKTLNFHFPSCLQCQRFREQKADTGKSRSIHCFCLYIVTLHWMRASTSWKVNTLRCTRTHVRCRHYQCNAWLLTTDRAVWCTVTVQHSVESTRFMDVTWRQKQIRQNSGCVCLYKDYLYCIHYFMYCRCPEL